MPPPPDRAFVWKRTDFSESSRLVTLLTRRDGKTKALAKGAHRANSEFFGRLDFLNLVQPGYVRARRGSELRILRSVRLLHEPRGLRSLPRYLAASHLVELVDVAMPEGRPDPDLFDLLAGAVTILERCPIEGLRTAIAGIELRFLATLGVLADLGGCTDCGARGPLFVPARRPGLFCHRHCEAGARRLGGASATWLGEIAATPAAHWHRAPPPPGEALAVLGGWIATQVAQPLRMRRPALLAAGESPGALARG